MTTNGNEERPLPPGWTWTTLENCVDTLDRYRVPINASERTKRIEGKPQSELIPYYGATGQVGWIDDHIFDEELVLLGEDGAPFLDVDKDIAYVIRGKSWVNNHAHVLRALNSLTSNSYLLHYLNTFDFHECVTGTTRLKLNQSRMKEIPVPLAPLPEQERIVAEIEKQFTRLDTAVATLHRLQANLNRYKASVLKAACEGRLVPQNPDDEPADQLLQRILAERRAQWQAANPGKKYQEPEGVGGTAVLPALPDGWVWASIEQIVDVATGATPKRGNSSYWDNGTIPWITSAVVNELFVDEASEFITEQAIRESNTKVFPQGTLLVAMYGEGKTRGKVTEMRLDAATNQALAALLFTGTSNCCKPYIKLFLEKNYEDIRRLSSGGVQPNLNLSIIKSTKIPLPPLAEQHRIVAEVERRLSVVAATQQAITANLARANRLRQAILHRAFSGQLV